MAGESSQANPSGRRQQLVMLILALCLTALWIWRATWPRSAPPTPKPTAQSTFVAIAGAVPHPGVYRFAAPPVVRQVWQAAGGQGDLSEATAPLRSGSTIIVAPDRTTTVSTMPGPNLITLGLALDLNRASAADLQAIPGLGPVLADRIISYRSEHGPFHNVDDLLQVKGIGPKLLEKIRSYVVIIAETDGMQNQLGIPGPDRD